MTTTLTTADLDRIADEVAARVLAALTSTGAITLPPVAAVRPTVGLELAAGTKRPGAAVRVPEAAE